MPTLLCWNGVRFFFYSADGSEPAHVHVVKGGCKATIWLHDLSVAVNIGYSAQDLNAIGRKTRDQRERFLGRGMTILQIVAEDARLVAASCDDAHLHVALADGRALVAPLWWYPRLLSARPEEREEVELMPLGIHWPRVDEDIGVASILRGERAPGTKVPGP